MKTAILIDSTIVMTQEDKEKYNIFTVPLSINFNNVSYKESGDLKTMTEEILSKIEKDKVIPKTSQPSAVDFLDKYKEIKEKGFERVISLHISGKLSGTHQGSKVAADMFMEENEITIDVFDTINAAQCSVFVILDILKKINKNNEISNFQIQEIIDFYSTNSNALFMVDTLDYLSYGGRINSSVAALGNLFGIKPILQLKKGEIIEYSKARSQKKALKKIIEDLEKIIEENPTKKYYFSATHVLNEKDCNKLYNHFEKKLGARGEGYKPLSLSPVIGIHTGPGSVGVLLVEQMV